MKKRVWIKMIMSIVVLFFVLSGCGLTKPEEKQTKQQVVSSEQNIQKTSTPTVFFHGYSGGKGSFGSMLKRLTRLADATQEATIYVSETGELRQEGTVSKQKTNPMIQVIFEDNKSTQDNQAFWISEVLASLKTQGIEQVNLVGHSMGGVSIFDYLMQDQDTMHPLIEKVIAIGAPFNEFLDTFETQTQQELLQNGPDQLSARYENYQMGADYLPKDIQVEIISGELSADELSDGTVPLASSLSIIPLLNAEGINVHSTIITGEQAQHSALHENEKVDRVVANFLWK
ncbi:MULTISPECIES: alpha/beta hydrolase [Enterococcus]|uniref:Alpha/beta hydrolase n=1 Tax=Enterococcus sulfureus ATCC 49903 TaxID=1140003 RepID=S0L3M8_9ENTE|nr:alpha/beta hydrolase [Enterococcus sulfureus]EOT51457.1 hypothetical protein OMY_00171 [Enterococcus sulfureus ATCC 49903]EOT87114.1 hypothetical protein I573_00170 [Enterococcus sulfureus ATCC 49903]